MGRSSWASAWSTRRRWSPRPASWHATRSITAAAGRSAWKPLDEGGRKGLRLTFEDQGPGIPDIDLALTDGYTTGRGMGMGLSGSKRLVNEFEIDSRVGEGTRVTITRWK